MGKGKLVCIIDLVLFALTSVLAMPLNISAILSSVANGSISPADAADQITTSAPIVSIALPDDGSDTVGAEGFFWDLWDTLVDSARSQPESQEKFVKLVVEIGDPKRSQTTKWRVWGQAVSWSDFPLLGASVRESYNGPLSMDAAGVNNWVALNAFLARLTDANSKFMLYTIWALREALEEELTDDVAMNSSNVRSAAQWIIYAGEKVYASTEEFESGPQVGAPARGGPKWDGKHGFDPKRWALWKREFENISVANEKVDELARQDAKQAVEKMTEIEKA